MNHYFILGAGIILVFIVWVLYYLNAFGRAMNSGSSTSESLIPYVVASILVIVFLVLASTNQIYFLTQYLFLTILCLVLITVIPFGVDKAYRDSTSKKQLTTKEQEIKSLLSQTLTGEGVRLTAKDSYYIFRGTQNSNDKELGELFLMTLDKGLFDMNTRTETFAGFVTLCTLANDHRELSHIYKNAYDWCQSQKIYD